MHADSLDDLQNDIEKVKQIPIVPMMLEVICKTTGLGFAAIARVTDTRWVACSVRDEINFGLQSGGELKLETTLCNEVRANKEAIVIDDVSRDEKYVDHHTPKMYGLKSYIAVPIYMRDGSFFGTLCAIDPNPAALKNVATLGLFNLFSELLSFHLQSTELMQKSTQAISRLADENKQFQYITDHNLAEPLRKLSMFGDLIEQSARKHDVKKVVDLGAKMSLLARDFKAMIKDVSDYTDLSTNPTDLTAVDLNVILHQTKLQLTGVIEERKGAIHHARLPSINAIDSQIGQLFYHLLLNALSFTRQGVAPVVSISSRVSTREHFPELLDIRDSKEYLCLDFTDNGRGIDSNHLDKIFHMFSKLSNDASTAGNGIGLAQCRKIVKLHGGALLVKSVVNEGTTFTVVLPV